MTTLQELRGQLAEVDQLLYATWLREREDARRRIADLAVEYQVPLATMTKDVEGAQRSAAPAPSVLRAPNVDVPLRREGAPQHVEVRYRDRATGASWTGRGPRPRWLRQALEEGAQLEDFRVSDACADQGLADPLRQFQEASSRSSATRSA